MPYMLVNLKNSPLVFNLTHQCVRVRTNRFEYDQNSGERFRRRVSIKMPTTLRVGPKQRVTKGPDGKPLPDTLKDEPEIQAALNVKVNGRPRPWIKLIHVAVAPASTPEKPKRTTSRSTSRRSTSASTKPKDNSDNSEG